MSDNGYVLAYRRAWTHRAFRDKLDAAIWNYLYQSAAWQEEIVTSHGTRHLIRRGQIFISMRGLATDFCCSESRIRTLTEHLAAHAMVTTQNAHRGVIVTICNYDEYQSFENRERAQDASRPSAEHNAERALYNKDETKKERIKETKDSSSPAYSDDFESFWTAFPKQRAGSKEKAWVAWKSALTRATSEAIIAATALYALSDEVKRGFAKGAAAWLNDDRWNNDYTTKANTDGNRNPTRQSSPSRQPRRFAEQDYNAGTEGFVLVD